MNLPPYPKYKPSGVEWIGDVPEHWEVKRLKYSASINDEVLAETTDPDLELSYVDIGNVHPVDGITTAEAMVFEDAPSRARRIVRDGDTIVSTVRTYLRAIAPIRDPAPNTIASTGFAVVRPRSVSPRFMSFALREPGFIEAIVARSVGVSYPAVNASEIGMLPIPIPEETEQQAVADFLDHETMKIDTLIAKQRTLTERLKEKRAALITRTVTRGLPPDAARAAGLDPYPKLKSSGVGWIGDVPEHWSVKRLRMTTENIIDQTTGNSDLEIYIALEYVESWTGRIREYDSDVACDGQVKRFRTNDVLFGKLRPYLAKITRPNANGVCVGEFLVLRPRNDELIPNYLEYFLKCKPLIDLISASTFGAKMPRADWQFISGLLHPLPPLSEQITISDFIDRETEKIDDLIANIETSIERLREYRSAIIDAAVTGKIDARTVDTRENVPSRSRSQWEEPT